MSYHYMSVFDHHTGMPLYLGRTKRIATPGQRIVLARQTTAAVPGPAAPWPGADCQVHHAVTEWAHGGQTDIDDLTLACPRDNRSVKPGWKTRKRQDGRTEWIPPPHLDSGQSRVNDYYHPESYLVDENDDEADDG